MLSATDADVKRAGNRSKDRSSRVDLHKQSQRSSVVNGCDRAERVTVNNFKRNIQGKCRVVTSDGTRIRENGAGSWIVGKLVTTQLISNKGRVTVERTENRLIVNIIKLNVREDDKRSIGRNCTSSQTGKQDVQPQTSQPSGSLQSPWRKGTTSNTGAKVLIVVSALYNELSTDQERAWPCLLGGRIPASFLSRDTGVKPLRCIFPGQPV
jgi:hypothetical protein